MSEPQSQKGDIWRKTHCLGFRLISLAFSLTFLFSFSSGFGVLLNALLRRVRCKMKAWGEGEGGERGGRRR